MNIIRIFDYEYIIIKSDIRNGNFVIPRLNESNQETIENFWTIELLKLETKFFKWNNMGECFSTQLGMNYERLQIDMQVV